MDAFPTLIFLFVLSLCDCAKLPPTFTKCEQRSDDFRKCLPKAVTNALQQLSRPFKEVGLPNLEAVKIPSVTIEAAPGPTSLTQKFSNIKVKGLTDVECTVWNPVLEENKIIAECFHPQMILDGDYEIKGKVLLLDVQGKGPASFELKNVSASIVYHLEEYEKKGEKYYRVLYTDMKLVPDLVKFHFEKLLNGEEAWNNEITKLLDENWKDVYGGLKPSYEEVFAKLISQVFNSLLSRVPIKDLWGEK